MQISCFCTKIETIHDSHGTKKTNFFFVVTRYFSLLIEVVFYLIYTKQSTKLSTKGFYTYFYNKQHSFRSKTKCLKLHRGSGKTKVSLTSMKIPN